MMTWIREKFGTTVIMGIIGFIAFVFVVSGVFSPKATRGLHEASVAGIVNGDPVRLDEFREAMRNRIEFFKNLGGGSFTEEQLEKFGLKSAVFSDLVNRKLVFHEATRAGVLPSDEEVRDRIQEIPAFQKDGRFDVAVYKRVIEASPYRTPSVFERKLREDLTVQKWSEQFKDRVHVSQEEARKQFLVENDKRDLKYVLVTPEAGRKGVMVSQDEVVKFEKDATKQNLAKDVYERKKATEFKGKDFNAVKDSIIKDLIAGDKIDEAKKVNQKVVDAVLPLLSADTHSDDKVKAVLKPYGLEIKKTGWITRSNSNLPGIGPDKELMEDAFSQKLEGKAKAFQRPMGTLIAVLAGVEKPDLSKFGVEEEKLLKQLTYRKAQQLQNEWLDGVRKRAKIEPNEDVVGKMAKGPGE